MNFTIEGHPNGCMAVAQARHAGFVEGVDVRLFHDDEVGIVVGHTSTIVGYPQEDPPYCIIVQFQRGIFNYRIRELVLV